MLMELEESLRRLPADELEPRGIEHEICRVKIIFSRQRVLGAARLLAADPGAGVLACLADEVEAASPPFSRGDFTETADRLAAVARDLNTLLAARECRA